MDAYTKSGLEIGLASQARGCQHGPDIAALTHGGFVATWTCLSGAMGEASGADVRAGLFGGARPARGDFLVNTRLLDHQQGAAVTGLGDGGFAIAWEDYGVPNGPSVKAKVFGPDAAVIADEFPVDPKARGEQSCPAVAALADGFVVAWQQDTGRRGGTDVWLALFNADGTRVGRPLPVSEATAGYQASPAVAALGDGGFVVAWQDFSGRGGDRSASGVKARLFGPDAEPWGPEFLVNTEIWNDQALPAVTGLGDGGFAVAWTCYSGRGGDGSGTGIKARLFSAAGEPRGDEFLVNTETLNSQVSPALAGLSEGGLVITWTCYSGRGADRSGASIKAKVFNADGSVAADEFLANTATEGDQTASAVAALPEGGFVVAWQCAGGRLGGATAVKAQVFSPTRLPLLASAGRDRPAEDRSRAA